MTELPDWLQPPKPQRQNPPQPAQNPTPPPQPIIPQVIPPQNPVPPGRLPPLPDEFLQAHRERKLTPKLEKRQQEIAEEFEDKEKERVVKKKRDKTSIVIFIGIILIALIGSGIAGINLLYAKTPQQIAASVQYLHIESALMLLAIVVLAIFVDWRTRRF